MKLRLAADIRGAPKTLELEGETLTFGRGEKADVQIEDLSLARVHFRLSFEAGRWWVEDLESPAGTWLDDAQLRSKQTFAPGMSLRAGGTTLKLT